METKLNLIVNLHIFMLKLMLNSSEIIVKLVKYFVLTLLYIP